MFASQLPRDFDFDAKAAGCVDHLDPGVGLTGWVMDLERSGAPIGLVASIGANVIGRTIALRSREDIDALFGEPTNCGFLFGWSGFDPDQLRRLLEVHGDAAIEVSALRHRMRLQWSVPQLTLRGLLDHITASPLGDRSPQNSRTNDAADILNSGLFDPSWYLSEYPLDGATGEEALLHFLDYGEKAGLQPNFYFDSAFFARTRRLAGPKGALLRYIREADIASSTSIHFDGGWYAAQHRVPRGSSALAAYLRRRNTDNPNPFFDRALYGASYADAAASPDSYVHFVRIGALQGRVASKIFDPNAYRREHLRDDRSINPFLHFLGRQARSPKPAASPIDAEGAQPGSVARQAATELILSGRSDDGSLPGEFRSAAIPWTDPRLAADQICALGLFDSTFYLERNPDVAASGIDPALHFASTGMLEQRDPNPLFDSVWYAKKHFKLPPPEGSFRHYIEQGEGNGLKPCPIFDLAWYAATYGAPLGGGRALSHYLRNRASLRVAPNAYFSAEDYLGRYPDIAASDVDPFTHWFNWGIFEGRRASDRFDPEFVWRRHLGNDRSKNPFSVFMDIGLELGWAPTSTEQETTFHLQLKANCAPGPHYEDLAPPSPGLRPQAKAMAFYLTQFHPIPENDAWWGTGFTEWRNVARGSPRFDGHYQPRIPRDLGFYSLEDPTVMRRQVALAKRMGLHGFSFYYYNFNGRRLLEKPLDAFLRDSEIEFPFSLIWANENWTRRWDGMEQDVLVRQDYLAEHQDALIDDLAGYLKHRNYLQLEGRPFLGIYRADIIPDCKETIERWREAFRDRHGLNPFIAMAQTFGFTDPRPFGFDGAFEFPPHKIGGIVKDIGAELRFFDQGFEGSVRSYDDAVEAATAEPKNAYHLIKTAFPMWDNDARKQGAGMIFHGSTPAKFEDWIRRNVSFAKANPVGSESLIFVNAWNEWCEGAYLEPDCHYGFAYINALSRGLMQARGLATREKLVLVGHDAYAAGAQQLLLYMGRTFKHQFGSEVAFILMQGGDLLPRYQEIGDVYVADSVGDIWPRLNEHIQALRTKGFSAAITNSVFSGAGANCLSENGFRVVSLIHELPTLVKEHHGEALYRAIAERADAVVFPNRFVRQEMTQAFGEPKDTVLIRPQGVYKTIAFDAAARARIRSQLGLGLEDRLVINVGHGDLRKGVDLFVGTAAAVRKRRKDIHFLWLGSHHPNVLTWLKRDIDRAGAGHVHLQAFTDDVAAYLSAADLFYLTSREDPFPTVVLEALACGLPVASFDSGGGYVELLQDPRLGLTLPYADIGAAAERLIAALDDSELRSPARRAHRRNFVSERFDFSEYCAEIAATALPARQRVSVIIPNYNYARYIESRLQSVFDQSYPIFEVIVLDDASTDGSLHAIEDVIARTGRRVRVEAAGTNSGNVFRQWRRGLEMARGDLIWIAEADDLSDPTFLARLVAAMQSEPEARFAFCDSRAIDGESAPLYESYKGYYAAYGDQGLARDGTFEAREFMRRFLAARNLILNASSVLWNASHLRSVFTRLGDEAFRFTCAGDWRIYLESCRMGGKVQFVADCLNVHRRHQASVTHSLSKSQHLAEISHIQDLAKSLFPNDISLEQEIDMIRTDLKKEWATDLPRHVA